MTPTLGRIVHYRLTAEEAKAINKRRADWKRNGAFSGMAGMTPVLGYQAHVGNPVSEGEAIPMIVTAIWPNEFGEGIHGVNGQVFLDGNDSLWVTSVKCGDEPGTYHYSNTI